MLPPAWWEKSYLPCSLQSSHAAITITSPQPFSKGRYTGPTSQDDVTKGKKQYMKRGNMCTLQPCVHLPLSLQSHVLSAVCQLNLWTTDQNQERAGPQVSERNTWPWSFQGNNTVENLRIATNTVREDGQQTSSLFPYTRKKLSLKQWEKTNTCITYNQCKYSDQRNIKPNFNKFRTYLEDP